MIIILGGGLAGSLIALRLAALKKPPPFLLLDAQATPGGSGNHTWSFHDTDLPPSCREWMLTLCDQSWSSQEVRFPNLKRILKAPYHAIRSESLGAKTVNILESRWLPNSRVLTLRTNSHSNEIEITLEDGKKLSSNCVIDARGFDETDLRSPNAYQTFLGLDLEIDGPHEVLRPRIMDTLELGQDSQQHDYCFFYLLPWSETNLLIENTRYSVNKTIDPVEFEAEIREYCVKKGWKIKNTLRRESGALPIPLYPYSQPESESNVIRLGVRSGQFHATTGYSLPFLLRQIAAIVEVFETEEFPTHDQLKRALVPSFKLWKKQLRFFCILNRMVFNAALPGQRWRIFERFYRLSESLIFKFYRGELSYLDRIKIVWGTPPVPIRLAIRSLFR